MTTTDEQVAKATWSTFLRAFEPHEKYLRLAKRCNGFYLGEHWREEDRRILEAAGRPALVFNLVKPLVNTLCGHFLETQADIVLKPRGGGATEAMATVLTRLIDIVLDDNDYHDLVEPLVIADGVIEQRGYVDVRIDFETNVLGDVRITPVDPRTVVLDPGAQDADPATWGEVYLDRWMTLDEVEALYGKKVRERVVLRALSTTELSRRAFDIDTFGGDRGEGHWTIGTHGLEERHIRSVRVIERQHRKRSLGREMINPETGHARPVPEGWDEDRIRAVSEAYGLIVRSRAFNRIRWTVVAGDGFTLFDDWSPYDEFTIVPFFPHFRRGRPGGFVEDLIDPQEYLNKTESQSLHIINTTANSGWLVEAGSLLNMTEEELEDRGASTGLVVVYGRGRQPPDKIQPNQIPTGLQNFASRAGEYISAISGAGALLGSDARPEVSGVQLSSRISNALTGLALPMKNLRFMRRLLARRILSLIQRFYTEPRVFLATDWSDPELTQEEIVINQQVAGAIVNNVAPGEYHVSVGEAPARDTMEEKQFADALQLREAGIPIPAYRVVQASPLADKRAIAEEVRALEGLGEPTEIDIMVQQIQLQRAQLELAELEAKVEELRARAMLQTARAGASQTEAQRSTVDMVHKYEMEVARLRADVAKFSANLENKLQLAHVHSETKAGLARFNQTLSAQQKERDREAALQRTVIEAVSRQQGANNPDPRRML